ncbi:MAG: hypothetical protein M0P71_13060 [Melioribacteraceae bacterium]|jgi:hypothetical protein|nr:hypothetical protein [Melioribacteraceae bacterium]
MDEIKSIHYVLQELMRRYNEGFAVAKDDIMELCVEYEIDNFFDEVNSILAKLMPVGTIGTVEYPFGEVDIT